MRQTKEQSRYHAVILIVVNAEYKIYIYVNIKKLKVESKKYTAASRK